ncbi:hypothetical protein KIN20_022776 [Parelaphostrongylus tenuis]|uniref:Lipoprotein n=1 Tax=Parelaphostrongylus tenuis TaxID=148309 RepID=A0AAD5QX01_PARTN|nr:hypothetical protein KIN20_022776 [Parelaphostrongylus tenuis]
MMKPSTTGLLMTSVLIITTVLGCGVMPPGQASTRSFIVSGFSLPVTMVYSGEADVRARVPGIALSKEAATGFISRLVMQIVFDVIEQQGRNALLPDAIISAILDQLRVQINYEPLECKAVAVDAQVTMQKFCDLRMSYAAHRICSCRDPVSSTGCGLPKSMVAA